MASRRLGRVLLILGVILIVGGLFALFYATLPAGVQETAPIAANDPTTEYFNEYSFGVLAGGTVQGTFSVVNGTPVTVFVFNDADYNSYMNGQNLTGLYTVTAVNGTLNLQVPGWNTYHIVFAHGPGYGSVEQDVAVDLTSTGIDPTFFLGGLVAAGIGALLVVFGVRQARRSRAQGPSGVLDSRATYLPQPVPPVGGTGPSGGDMYRVPPPLPGTTDGSATPPVQPDSAATPTGDVVVTLENQLQGAETVQLVVNGVPVTMLTLPPNTSQVTTVTARLSSPFGSMVTVQAVTSGGRRLEQSVFVGARGTAPVMLRLG
ncbi:MAG TPA: hypothetical protein VEY12_08885 [Thermoplasmata archaeon]|nr:hypothetical protein [Thermoplasmata archaeon]